MKKIVLAFLMLAGSTSLFAQKSLALYGSYIKNLNPDGKGNTPGIGLRFEFGNEESSLVKFVGLSYAFPMYATEELEARAYSNQTNPSTVDVTARYTRPLYRAELGGNYYLAGDATTEAPFSWFLTGGAEVIYFGNKAEYSSFDEELYTLGNTKDSDVNQDGSDKFGLNAFIMAGTGVEKTMGPGKLFLQSTISFPATTIGGSDNSGSIVSFTPIPLNFNLGYKISF